MDEMEKALIEDGEKLRALTGEDHGPFCPECNGDGWYVVPVCCGRGQFECCGDPDPAQQECEACYGTGKLQAPLPATPNT